MNLELCDQRILDALSRLSATPDTASYNALAWAYRDLMAYYLQNLDNAGLSDCMDCIEQLGYHDLQFNSNILNLIINILRRHKGNIWSANIDKFFHFVIYLDIDRGSLLYKQILNAFLLNSRLWGSIGSFCDWWDFDNLSDGDFHAGADGYALACHAYEAYSRFLVKCGFSCHNLKFFADFISHMPDGDFTPYANFHIASFLTYLHCDRQLILRVLRPYIKLKHAKTWSWTAVADIYEEKDIKHRACLYFALQCSLEFPDYLNLSLWYRLARYFSHTGEMDYARYFLDLICDKHPDSRADIHREFSKVYRLSAEKEYPDTFWDYREICHAMFADVRDVDNDLWIYLAGWIKGFSLS